MLLEARGTFSDFPAFVPTLVCSQCHSWYLVTRLDQADFIDLHTFGFAFRPWTENITIAEGGKIRKYMKETAEEYGIDRKIQFRHKLEAANWSSDQQNWSLTVDASGQTKKFNCQFLLLCTGYYNYHEALPAEIPGIENFKGPVLHPQFWPEDLDYTNKKVVIIGSGATAITLLPNIAKKAASVTMLQRSPSYVLPVPQTDSINNLVRRFLPATWAFKIIRMKFFLLGFMFFQFCRAFPNAAKANVQKAAASKLPKDYPLKPNFDPTYNPWDQRVCFSPEGDFFDAIKGGKADVVTATIKNITADSINLEGSEKTLNPDIIVTATGLKVQIAGGSKITVDGKPVNVSSKYLYKGIMLQDVPNAAIVIGYTNASWTLGADATAHFVTRLLNHMKTNKYTSAIPVVNDASALHEEEVLNLKSTYIVRAKGALPKAGNKAPWLPRTNYLRDLWEAQHGAYNDLHFSSVST